jgi:hypothetical protein
MNTRQIVGVAQVLDGLEGPGLPWHDSTRSHFRLLSENDPVRVYLRAYVKWLEDGTRKEGDDQ